MGNYWYKKLFEVKLFHHYYLNKGNTEYDDLTDEEKQQLEERYDITRDFVFAPAQETLKALKNLRAIFKTHAFGFVTGVLTDPNDVDKIFQDVTGEKLRFAMHVANPYVLNFSSLPLQQSGKQIYYFSNKAGGEGAVFPSLSLPVPDYQTGSDYEMNSLVIFAGQLYEAEENIESSSTDPDVGGSGWKNIFLLDYVTIADRITLYPTVFTYAVSSVISEAHFQVLDENSNIVYTDTEENQDSILKHQYNLQGLDPGKYTLRVTNAADDSLIESQEFYYDNELYKQNAFGMIEIYGDSLLGSYSLTDGSGNLQSPVYQLRIRNRSTLWRYLNSTDQTVQLESGPNPLTANGYVQVQLSGDDLPNPRVNIIKPEDETIVSEIFI